MTNTSDFFTYWSLWIGIQPKPIIGMFRSKFHTLDVFNQTKTQLYIFFLDLNRAFLCNLKTDFEYWVLLYSNPKNTEIQHWNFSALNAVLYKSVHIHLHIDFTQG